MEAKKLIVTWGEGGLFPFWCPSSQVPIMGQSLDAGLWVSSCHPCCRVILSSTLTANCNLLLPPNISHSFKGLQLPRPSLLFHCFPFFILINSQWPPYACWLTMASKDKLNTLGIQVVDSARSYGLVRPKSKNADYLR